MGKKEKAEFLLEQIRLTLAQKDFIGAAIISNKVRFMSQVQGALPLQ